MSEAEGEPGPEPGVPAGSGAGGPVAGQPISRFRAVAERVLDALLEASPQSATELGDHRFDDRLDDLSERGIEGRGAMLGEALSALDAVDDAGLDAAERVDLEILRTMVARDLWTVTELCPHRSDPLVHLPGDALYPLLVREVSDPAGVVRALTTRMGGIPDRLATARATLGEMPRVHVETAIGQARGTIEMLGAQVDALLGRDPALRPPALAAREAAAEALADHVRWLESRLPDSDGDPRLGEERFAAKLWYTLDTQTTPDALLTRAESDLQAVEEELAELTSGLASELTPELTSELPDAPPAAGQVRSMLDRLAAGAHVTDTTILGLCRQALADTTRRVGELDLVSIPDDPIQIIVMPEFRRGVAVAYCDPPGPLEPPTSDGRALPSLFAVSPTPSGWGPERVASFYREYNGHMLRNLTVHEAMPGHVLQLAHAARYRGSTRVRAAAASGPFIEGWAVYAESQLARAGLGLGPEADAGLRLQQLKMQLRMTINAILDVRVHAHGMTESEAMALMTGRGHQEDGEAAGKWRRALLTSAQLSTYYVGYHEVRDIVQRLRDSRPAGTPDRVLHDAVLSYGSPPPRHLRNLLGLPGGLPTRR